MKRPALLFLLSVATVAFSGLTFAQSWDPLDHHFDDGAPPDNEGNNEAPPENESDNEAPPDNEAAAENAAEAENEAPPDNDADNQAVLWVVPTGDTLLLGILPQSEDFPTVDRLRNGANACAYRITQGRHVWEMTTSLGEPSLTAYGDGSVSLQQGCPLDFPAGLEDPSEAAWPGAQPVVVRVSIDLGDEVLSLGPQTIRPDPGQLTSWEAVRAGLTEAGIDSFPNDSVSEVTPEAYTHYMTLHTSECEVVTGITQGSPDRDARCRCGEQGEACCKSGPGIRVSMTAYPNCPAAERDRIFEVVGSLLAP